MKRCARITALMLSLIVSCVLIGCSGARSKLEKVDPPKVSLIGVKVSDLNPLSPKFLVRLRLENPNDQDINLDGADAALALNGHKVAKGVSRTPIQLPKLGSSEVEVDVEATTFGVLKQLARASQQDTTPYIVTGSLHILESLGKLGAIPFRVQGNVKSADLLKLGTKTSR